MLFEQLNLNTQLIKYPSIINNNFKVLENTITNFYLTDESIKTYKLQYASSENKSALLKKIDKGLLIAPVNNSSVTSNMGKFINLYADTANFNKITASTIEGFVKFSNLDTKYFNIDDDENITLNTDYISEYEKQLTLLWGSDVSKTTFKNNLLIGNIASISNLPIKEQSNPTKNTILIGSNILEKIQLGDNNTIIGNNIFKLAKQANNNVILSNDFENDTAGLFKNNIIIGTTKKQSLTNNILSNVFSVGFSDNPYLSGNMSTGSLRFENNNGKIELSSNINILSLNKENKSTININIGNNTLSNDFNNTSGNINIGSNNSYLDSLGNNNILIGNNIDNTLLSTNENSLFIGNNEMPYIIGEVINDNQNISLYGNISVPDINMSASGTMVGVDAQNNIVKLVSSKKYKKNIIPVTDSSIIYRFEPIVYEDIFSDSGKMYYGFLAEDIEKIDDKLVTYCNGEVQSVAYERMVVLLVAELKKQHQRIVELTNKIK